MQLKKEDEIFSDKTEDFHITYVWKNWGLHRITDKIDEFLRKFSDTKGGMQTQY